MKKTITSLLIMLLAVVSAWGQTSGTCGDNATWELSSDGMLTISGTGAMQNYTYNDGTINSPWWNVRDNIKNVVVGEGITTIGNLAFYFCSALKAATLPASITTIGNSAFRKSGLESIDLSGCTGLTTIGNSTFDYCSALKSAALPASITTIGELAFCDCITLTTIYSLASRPPTLGEDVFYGITTSNVTVYVPIGSISTYQAKDGWKEFKYVEDYRCGDTAYWGYDTTNSINQLTISGTGAMYDYNISWVNSVNTPWWNIRYDIYRLTIGSGITTIGNYAFYQCGNFNPNAIIEVGAERDFIVDLSQCAILTTIGSYAFYNCNNLKAIDLSQCTALESIGDRAFNTCSKLKTVKFPINLTSIGSNAFDACIGLKEIYSLGDLPPTLGTDVFAGITKSNVTVYVPYGTADIYKNTSGWEDFNYKEEKNQCGDNAYWTLDSDGVLTISGTGAMWDYTYNNGAANTPWWSVKDNIKNVVIGEGITTIGSYALYYCRALKSAALPASITTIGNAFQNSGLESINLSGCTGLTTIGNHAFYECSALKSAALPASITTIGDNAFWNCVSLKTIYLLASRPSTLGTNVFAGILKSNVTVYVPIGSISTYQAKDGWDGFNYAEGGKCGNTAYWGYDTTNSINQLTISGTGAMYDFIPVFGIVTTPWRSEIYNMKSLKVGSGITTIGNYAFYQCGNFNPNAIIAVGTERDFIVDLSQCTILTTIGSYAFYNCNNLKAIDLSQCVALETIGDRAFNTCSKLKTLSLPASLTTVGDKAFENCRSLTAITSLATVPPTLGTDVFANVDKSIPVIVPVGTVDAHKAADGWKEFTNISDGATGIEDITGAADVITIEGNNIVLSKAQQVTVYSLAGALIYQGYTDSITIDETGMYIVKIASGAVKIVIR